MDGLVVKMSEDKDARAMDLFEQAMKKELHGLMADAVRLYREAFKINDRIDLLYRQEKVPKAIQDLRREHGKNSSRKVDEHVVRNLDVVALLDLYAMETVHPPGSSENGAELESGDGTDHVTSLMGQLSTSLHVELAVSPLTRLHNEIWVYILQLVLRDDCEAWFRFGITCRKHAFLAFASLSAVWRDFCYLVYPSQAWQENQTGQEVVPRDPLQSLSEYGGWRKMLADRPFIKFLGCYVSVVNYYTEGGREEFSLAWNSPVRTVTYYRYLRFYPNGECIMALTSLEPDKVIPQFSRRNPHMCMFPNSEVKDTLVPWHKQSHRIFSGRWTINTESEVHVCVENGSVPYYNFHYVFAIRNLGAVSKHAKLTWVEFYAIRKKMKEDDDREGEVAEFGMRKEKPFKFSRVRSYTVEN